MKPTGPAQYTLVNPFSYYKQKREGKYTFTTDMTLVVDESYGGSPDGCGEGRAVPMTEIAVHVC